MNERTSSSRRKRKESKTPLSLLRTRVPAHVRQGPTGLLLTVQLCDSRLAIRKSAQAAACATAEWIFGGE